MALIRISATTTATLVSDAKPGRRAIMLENSDANRCYVLIGPGTVSTTNYSFSLAQNESAAYPVADMVSAVWGTAGTGELKATELG